MKRTNHRRHRGLLLPNVRLAALVALPIAFGSEAWGQCAGALVDDAASFQWIYDRAGAGVAPGEIVTLLGQKLGPAQSAGFELNQQGQVPTTLDGVQVLIGGIPAPVIYASANQVSAIVPFNFAGGSVSLSVNDVPSCFSIAANVLTAAPSIFTANSQGFGQAVAANADATLNGGSNPAAPGSFITFYITGAGQTDPPSVAGAVAPGVANIVLPFSVSIGGQPAPVLYAGMAPGIVEGISQINAIVPSSLPYGGDWPLAIQVGGVSSQAGVTVAVAGPPLSATPPAPDDLRFKGIHASVAFNEDPLCNNPEDCEVQLGNGLSVPDIASLPALTPNGSEWRFDPLQPAGLKTPVTGIVASGNGLFANEAASLMTASTVITAIDFEAAGYAIAAMRTSATGGFDGELQTAAAANFAAAASQQASQGRVITAVSYSSPGTICFLSYSRQNDSSAYEASVATAPTAGEAIAAATNLAASGSIITGFGGNTVNGYVMVGTRVNGNATPRPLQVAQSAGSLPSQGYVQVGSVSDASSGPTIFIFEK